MIKFIYQGELIAKERARKGRGNHWYTPTRTQDFERTIGFLASAKMAGRKPLEGHVGVTVYMRCKKRKDADNIFKSCTDAMNKIVYLDDSQIVASLIYKTFCDSKKEGEAVEILVYKINSLRYAAINTTCPQGIMK